MSIRTKDRQFVSVSDLHEAGYSNYKIKQLAAEGDIARINRKWYEIADYSGEINDFYAVRAYAERGVVCLLSASVYYDLTTHRPTCVDVALPRSARVPAAPEWPPMRFYRMSGSRYSLGIVTVKEGENSFRIYDKEKTVCDVVFYRNKLGIEVASEVLKSYVRNSDRDLNRLMKYAEDLHVKATIQQYLEVLL